MPILPLVTVDRVRRIRAAGSKLGLDVHLWSKSIEARRVRLLRHAGVSTVFDVGANTGQYAGELRRAGYTGRIVSFEPIPEAFAALNDATHSDPSWVAVRSALGEEVGEVQLAVSESSVFSTTRVPTDRLLGTAPSARGVRSEAVPLTTLDAYVGEQVHDTGPLGLKIDVQGAEQEVLGGAAHTLARVAYLELELPLEAVYEGQWTFSEAIAALSADGFQPAAFENLLPHPESGASLQANVLFTRALSAST